MREEKVSEAGHSEESSKSKAAFARGSTRAIDNGPSF